MTPTPNDLNLIHTLTRKERRRVWSMAFICVLAWMAVVMIPWALILPLIAKLTEGGQLLQGHDAALLIHEAVIRTFFCSVLSMAFAAFSTVFFVSVSRRATMRQINENLREISAQLETLATTSG